ncbi:MAG: chromosome segregation protein SMC, partial [Proteobacteria bacterium]|nr:chromosome segregation protein SMC [Pseudomonadota bacterium]
VVSRDGTSKYFLHNSRCRRKDITHMLLGTGLGSHGYSIIEQGMISRLVEARPEELRAFLEEAAGISKYKERRRETEHRIRRTRENLDRLNDLLEEVGKQIGHLQRQARAAERFKSLKADQRRMEAELLMLRLSALQDNHGSRCTHLDEKRTGLEAALARQRAAEALIEELRLELDECNSRHGDVRSRALEVDSEISRLEQSLEHHRRLQQRQKLDLKEIAGQLVQSQALSDSDRAAIQRVDSLLDELGPGLASARSAHRETLDDLRKAEQVWEASQEQLGRIIETFAEAEHKERIEDERLGHLRANHQRLQEERGQLEEAQSGRNAERLQERLEELAAEEKTLERAIEAAAAALEGMLNQLQSLRESEAGTTLRRDEARQQLHEQRGRLASLKALQEAAAEPASRQVGDWLSNSDLLSSARYAEALKVQEGWETAVETVLGDYLQAVCVDEIDEAAPGLAQLTAGHVTLWDGSIANDPAGRGPRRMLRHFVMGPAVDRLLKGVRAAETVTEALAIRKRLRPHESVVTRDGLWVGRQWIRIRRDADPQAGLLARADEIKKLCKSIASSAEQVEALETTLGGIRAELERIEAGLGSAQSDAGEHQQRYADVRSELESGRSRLEEWLRRNQAGQLRIGEITEELRGLVEREARSLAVFESARTRRKELADKRVELQVLRDEHRRRLDESRAHEDQARADVQNLSLRIEAEKSTRESAVGALDRVRDQQDHLHRRRGELEAEVQAAVEPMAEERRALEKQLQEKLRVQDQLHAARGAVEDVESRLRDSKFSHAGQERNVEAAREAVEEARLDVREVEVRMDSVSTELSGTGFDSAQILESLPEDASVSSWETGLEKLERRIRLLGSVNLAAIDELEQQAQRKQYLDDQFADLGKALATLENAIRKIDRETRTRFDETFKAANAGLARLFPRLYGGGHAYLELDGDDLLTSGVTIMARPPGKRVSTIHLLSGGEKALTAVALVFSIFELNPAPFCLLDEVDAPLDDANVGRFAEIVSEMSQRVQFVLITHNKTTMESMQQLTGVTMSEPGVSRLVAVDIDEAVQLAAV